MACIIFKHNFSMSLNEICNFLSEDVYSIMLFISVDKTFFVDALTSIKAIVED